MRIIRFFIVFVSILSVWAGVSSCGSSDNRTRHHHRSYDGDDEEEDNSDVFKTYKASYSFDLVGSGEEYGYDEDVNVTNKASVKIPEKINGRKVGILRDTILMRTIGNTSSDIQQSVDNFVKESVFADNDFPMVKADERTGYDMNIWYETLTGDIYDLNDKTLTYLISTETYGGGAHPFGTRSYINYSIKDGKILTLKDLFTPYGLSHLPLIIKQKLISENPENADMIWVEDIPAGGNFKLKDNQIIFCYGEYEAAPYSMGYVEAAFYPYELNEFLTAYGREFFDLED